MLHLSVTDELVEVTLSARIAFSKRSWPFVLATAVPWVLCTGQRSITRLFSLGSHRRSRSAYYRFLSEGKWYLTILFRALFELIIRTFSLDQIILVVDDTLCPKWGRKIFGTARHFDHVGRPRPGFIWGHNWIVLSVVVPIGSRGAVALPFWIALYRPKATCSKEQFRTRHQIVAKALEHVRSWFSGPILLLGDGAYGNRSLIVPAKELDIVVVSRLRCDARLRRPQPRQTSPRKRGRKPTRGPYLPRLRELARQTKCFQRFQVRIYGRIVELDLREIEAWWSPLRAVIKLVITRDPNNPKRVAFLMSTNCSMSSVEIVEMFARRWTIEQLFAVAKNQLGLDSAEVRKERSVIRHAVLCIAVATWTEIWAYKSRRDLRRATFNTKLAVLRESILMRTIFASSLRRGGSARIAKEFCQVFRTATSAA